MSDATANPAPKAPISAEDLKAKTEVVVGVTHRIMRLLKGRTLEVATMACADAVAELSMRSGDRHKFMVRFFHMVEDMSQLALKQKAEKLIKAE
jgi:hypothetical protein